MFVVWIHIIFTSLRWATRRDIRYVTVPRHDKTYTLYLHPPVHEYIEQLTEQWIHTFNQFSNNQSLNKQTSASVVSTYWSKPAPSYVYFNQSSENATQEPNIDEVEFETGTHTEANC